MRKTNNLQNLFVFILPFLTLSFYSKKYVLNSYDITIKIRGIGKQNIINTNNCPNEIYHSNGTLIGNNICEIDFDKKEYIIIMKWNNPISGNSFFKDKTNILEVDLSNLKKITGMLDMFNG